MDPETQTVYQLSEYLKEVFNAYNIYKSKIDEGLNIALGNVSCDMDSAIGAILLGYYLTLKSDYRSQPGNYEQFWLPVINCPRAEVVARLDIMFHLQKYGINHEELVYVDDIDISHYSENNLLKLALIDHNLLDVSQQSWGKSITMIVDHHKDEKAYLDFEHERIIEFCGSACSLVLRMIFNEKLENCMTPEIINFFLPAVLIDTENFKPNLEGTKWGNVDKDVIFQVNRFTTDHYYQELINKKTDKALNIQLGLQLILRKDYKNYVWKNCLTGISVVFNPIYEMLSTFGVDKLKLALKERMDENHLNFYMIISQIYSSKGAQRELVVFDNDVDRLQAVAKAFEKSHIKTTKKKFTGLKGNFLFYTLCDESLSRKKIEPVFHEIFEKL